MNPKSLIARAVENCDEWKIIKRHGRIQVIKITKKKGKRK